MSGRLGSASWGGVTRLVHAEKFSGVLVSLLKGTLKDTDKGFIAFNDALKQRAEQSGSTNPTPR